MNDMQLRTVSMENDTVTYLLIRKAVKNINLRVKKDGSVLVSAGRRVSAAYIDDFVRQKIPFIVQSIDKMKQSREQEVLQIQFVTGEQIPYLGGFLTLQVDRAERTLIPKWMEQIENGSITHFSRNKEAEALFCCKGSLFLYTTKPEDISHKQQLYDSWQKIQAKNICEQLSRQYYPQFQRLGVAYPVIKIRKMTSRWGSCIPQKQKITFNSLLLEKPLESIEYVVVHEFAHFIHPDHSKAFYDFVEQILPDWKKRKEELQKSVSC